MRFPGIVFRRFTHYLKTFPFESDKVAIRDDLGRHSYTELLSDSSKIASGLKKKCYNSRISILCPSHSHYVRALWGIWKSGNAAVPFCPSHPTASLDYFFRDSDSRILLSVEEFKDQAHSVVRHSNKELILLEDLLESQPIENDGDIGTDALVIYTSGTTGQPKGVLYTHDMIHSQIRSMVDPWKWTSNDCILHVLPLHHVHGIVNCLLVPLSVGASIKMLSNFEPDLVWKELLNDEELNVFMAVPTIYAKLIRRFNDLNLQSTTSILRDKFRLMVSGSAALPLPILEKWKEISGHTLLERYGMSEIGMALSNPLKEENRLPGFVGTPLPGVEVRIVSGTGRVIAQSDSNGNYWSNDDDDEKSGELQVRGSTVFKEYLGKDEATKAAFDGDWFLTGDTARMNEKGIFKILGRTSVDIIKRGGYKISALDIERVYLSHPTILEIVVCGLNDEVYGQSIAAIVVTSTPGLTLDKLRDWAKDKLPSYSLPSKLIVMESIPKNAMGKVDKKSLKKMVFDE